MQCDAVGACACACAANVLCCSGYRVLKVLLLTYLYLAARPPPSSRVPKNTFCIPETPTLPPPLSPLGDSPASGIYGPAFRSIVTKSDVQLGLRENDYVFGDLKVSKQPHRCL